VSVAVGRCGSSHYTEMIAVDKALEVVVEKMYLVAVGVFT